MVRLRYGLFLVFLSFSDFVDSAVISCEGVMLSTVLCVACIFVCT